MLLSQLKKLPHVLPRRYLFLSQLLLVATGIHSLFLLFIVWSSSIDQTLIIDITLASGDAPLVLVPLYKKVARPPAAHQGGGAPQSPQASLKKVRAITSSATILKTEKASPKKSPLPQKSPSNVSLKTEIKKNEPLDKKIINTPLAPAAPLPPIKKKSGVDANNSHEKMLPPLPPAPSLQVGYEELQLLELTQEITREIGQYWHRPRGINDTIVCHAKVYIDKTGNKNVVIEKSSGALIHDLGAKQALLEYTFPKTAWNRTLIFIM